MYRISYRFFVPGWSAKPLVSAHDRIMGTHRVPVEPDSQPLALLCEVGDPRRFDRESKIARWCGSW